MELHATLLIPENATAELIPGTVEVDGERLAHVETDARVDQSAWPARILAPGFIDAHVHFPQFDLIGAYGEPLLEWLESAVFRHEARWSDVEFAEGMTKRVLAELVRHGTTGVGAYLTAHPEGSRAAMVAASDFGLRGAFGQVLMDRGAPKELLVDAEPALAATESLLETFSPGSRVEAAITPRFALSCTDALLAGAGELAARSSAFVQTHLSETVAECEAALKAFPAANSYTEIYDGAGLLTSRSVFGHGIHLNDAELDVLRERGATIAHCPQANAFLGSGVFNRARALRHRVQVALGSDIGAGYSRAMPLVAADMLHAAMASAETPPTPAEAWWQITAGNAEALGFEGAGRLATGASADLIEFEPDLDWRSAPNPLGMLLFGWESRWVRRAWLRGQLVYSRPG